MSDSSSSFRSSSQETIQSIGTVTIRDIISIFLKALGRKAVGKEPILEALLLYGYNRHIIEKIILIYLSQGVIKVENCHRINVESLTADTLLLEICGEEKCINIYIEGSNVRLVLASSHYDTVDNIHPSTEL